MSEMFDKDASTPVPDAFIDVYMPKARKAGFALVYIIACRFASAGLECTAGQIAEKLNAPVGDVLEAWRFWEEQGIARLVGDGGEAKAELLPLDKRRLPVPVTKAGILRPDKPPAYAPEAIESSCRDDADAKYLFAMAERTLAKALTYTELNAVFSFYDWLKLSPPVIEVLLDYCVSNGHRGMRYIEKAAIDWADNGIETVEDAEEYIRLFNKDYREIMKAFGHSRRDPTKVEREYMKKWLKQLGMTVDVILAACDRTVKSIGEPKLSYADAILTKWHGAGVFTLPEIEKIEESFYQNLGKRPSGKAAAASPAAPRGKNRFNNFEGRKQDLDSLIELEQIYIEQRLQGEG